MLFGKNKKGKSPNKTRPENSGRSVDEDDEDDEIVTIYEEEEGEGQ